MKTFSGHAAHGAEQGECPGPLTGRGVPFEGHGHRLTAGSHLARQRLSGQAYGGGNLCCTGCTNK